MSKSTRNSGRLWTESEVRQLRQLAGTNTPTRVIGVKLGPTSGALYQRASQDRMSLRPTNQRPYGRRGR